MWHRMIDLSELQSGSAWKVERFRSDIGPSSSSNQDAIRLGALLSEREEVADPTSGQFAMLPYLGLDAIEPGTGEILAARTAVEQSIRSRSRVFREGDVLYGRLRAYLNKVAYIDRNIPLGTCSGEFYVLRADIAKVHPRFLQWLLLSDEMVAYVKPRLAGATHPRLALEDLLEYRVVLPPLERQIQAVRVVNEATALRQQLRLTLASLPAKTAARVREIAYG